jgi:glycine/D-amino acid oxidase-like deaminating enzyme
MNSPIPDKVDVAVIGGGIIGISTALSLSAAGVRVAVFEKGTIAAEQSSRNWGWIRSVGRDPKELPLSMMANRMWRDIQAQTDVGYRQTGLAYLTQTEADLQKHQAWMTSARDAGTDVRLLERDALRGLIPASNRPWIGALFSPTDGVAEPQLATAAIARLAVAQGARIVEQCAVRGLETRAGAVSGVVTEAGVVAADAVVLAGGAWSRLFCGNNAVNFPQLLVHASVLRTHPLNTGLDIAVNGSDFTCRKRSDGGYSVSQLGASIADLTPDSIRLWRQFLPAWLSQRQYLKLRLGRRFLDELKIPRRFELDAATPFEACRVLNPAPTMKMVNGALAKLKHAFPVFENATMAQAWAGYIDVTPDALPVIGPVPSIPGFFLASGFSGHGFGIGPAAGALMAELVQGNTPFTDPRPFSLERYRGWRA